MRSGLDALRLEPRYWKSSSRGVQRSAKRSGGPFQMLGLLAPWKSSTDDCPTTSAVEEVSNAAKSFEKNLAILQSSSNLAEEASKRANTLDVRILHSSVIVFRVLALCNQFCCLLQVYHFSYKSFTVYRPHTGRSGSLPAIKCRHMYNFRGIPVHRRHFHL